MARWLDRVLNGSGMNMLNSIHPTSHELLAAALVAAEADPDNDYLGFSHAISDIAERAGVDLESARGFLAELLRDGIVRQNAMHTADQFIVVDAKFAAWKQRRGL